jgi:16S rRNA C1402 N4-methylase RsmH
VPRTDRATTEQQSKQCLAPTGQCQCSQGVKLRCLAIVGDEEQRDNPRSRSAKLRVLEKLPSSEQ